MKVSNDRTPFGQGRALRLAVAFLAAATLLSCVAVPIPIPIPVVTGVRTGQAAEGGTRTVAREDGAPLSAAEAEAYAREACAEEGRSLGTLGRAAATDAGPDPTSFTFTCNP